MPRCITASLCLYFSSKFSDEYTQRARALAHTRTQLTHTHTHTHLSKFWQLAMLTPSLVFCVIDCWKYACRLVSIIASARKYNWQPFKIESTAAIYFVYFKCLLCALASLCTCMHVFRHTWKCCPCRILLLGVSWQLPGLCTETHDAPV